MIPGEYTLTYSYAGAADVVLTVNVVDTAAPVLELAGESELVLDDCAAYVEDGLAAVVDLCDGDMAGMLAEDDVLVSIWSVAQQMYVSTTLYDVADLFNDLYADTSGEYALVYAVQDASGNEGIVERVLTVNCIPARRRAC